ncbi:MAG: glycosyltransferase family 39 protein, partial [Thermoanaerobaculia bacterium]
MTTPPEQNMGTQRKGIFASPVCWIVLILLLAAALRVFGVIRISPPGLEHDEVANWLIDRAILEGNHAIYFAQAYGHEAGFHYLQAISVALLGDNALALRLPAVYAGIVLVAVHFALMRRVFNVKLALLSTMILAVLFWPVFYSRLGLRAILLPLVSGISLVCWWKAWDLGNAGAVVEDSLKPSRISQTSIFWFGLAGVFAGLTLYTYMAARAVPIFYGMFVLYLALFHWSVVKRQWRGMLLFGLLLVIVAAPLGIYLQANPGAEFRVTEIDAPLRALAAGNLRPSLENSLKILGMFGFMGDPLWRQNVAGRPVFGPLLAILFYIGLVLA